MANTMFSEVPAPRASAGQVANFALQRYMSDMEEARRARDQAIEVARMRATARAQAAQLDAQRRESEANRAVEQYNADTRRMAQRFQEQQARERAAAEGRAAGELGSTLAQSLELPSGSLPPISVAEPPNAVPMSGPGAGAVAPPPDSSQWLPQLGARVESQMGEARTQDRAALERAIGYGQPLNPAQQAEANRIVEGWAKPPPPEPVAPPTGAPPETAPIPVSPGVMSNGMRGIMPETPSPAPPPTAPPAPVPSYAPPPAEAPSGPAIAPQPIPSVRPTEPVAPPGARSGAPGPLTVPATAPIEDRLAQLQYEALGTAAQTDAELASQETAIGNRMAAIQRQLRNTREPQVINALARLGEDERQNYNAVRAKRMALAEHARRAPMAIESERMERAAHETPRREATTALNTARESFGQATNVDDLFKRLLNLPAQALQQPAVRALFDDFARRLALKERAAGTTAMVRNLSEFAASVHKENDLEQLDTLTNEFQGRAAREDLPLSDNARAYTERIVATRAAQILKRKHSEEAQAATQALTRFEGIFPTTRVREMRDVIAEARKEDIQLLRRAQNPTSVGQMTVRERRRAAELSSLRGALQYLEDAERALGHLRMTYGGDANVARVISYAWRAYGFGPEQTEPVLGTGAPPVQR